MVTLSLFLISVILLSLLLILDMYIFDISFFHAVQLMFETHISMGKFYLITAFITAFIAAVIIDYRRRMHESSSM